jgi:hypothetical protein
MDSSASNVYITGLDEATTYTFYGWAKSGNQRNSADASATTVEYSRRYFAQRRVFHFHDCAWRRYAADKNVTSFDVSWEPADGAMDTRMPMSTSLDEATAYFLWMGKNPAGISNSADASATTVEYSRFSRYFAQRRVLYFHDYGDGLRRRQNVTGFDVSWIPRRCHG